MNYAGILLILIIGLPFNNARALNTQTCSTITTPLRGEIFLHGLDVSENNCKKVSAIIQDLDRILYDLNPFNAVKGISFFFLNKSDQVSYSDKNYFNASLDISYDSNGNILLTPSQQKIIWTHEIAHAIFDRQMSVDWDWFNKRSQVMKNWGAAVVKSTNLENELVVESDLERRKIIQMEIDSLSNYISLQISEYNQLQNIGQFEEILAPYSEAFADIVALIDTQNPKAMSFALSNPQDPDGIHASPEEREVYEERDYSFIRDPKLWKQTEAHGMLAPALSFWWSKNKNNIIPINKKKLVKMFYTIILKEIKVRVENPGLWELSPEDANLRLMSEIAK